MKVIFFAVIFLFAGCSASVETVNPNDTVGANAGALAGTVVAGQEDTHSGRVEQQKKILSTQEYEIARQKKEIDDLRRQELLNKSLDRFSAPN